MPVETYTGRLSNDGPQVSIENGPILAIQGPEPCAAAARQCARFGETQPVTVSGTRGTVDSIPVLYVTSIGWAVQVSKFALAGDAVDEGGVMSIEEDVLAVKPAAPRKTLKKAAKKAAQKMPARKRAR